MTRSEHDFEQFYRDSKDRCLRAFLAVAPNAQAADDVVAEAFTRALERWAEVRSHPSPAAWVVPYSAGFDQLARRLSMIGCADGFPSGAVCDQLGMHRVRALLPALDAAAMRVARRLATRTA